MNPNTPAGMVTFVSETKKSLTMAIANDPGGTGGVGGWETIQRLAQEDAQWWKSTPARTYPLQLILDIETPAGMSIEDRLNVLYGMGKPASGASQPPWIKLYGDTPTARGPKWKIDEITLEERIFDKENPSVLRQQTLTVALGSYIALDEISKVSVKATRNGGKRRRRTIFAKKGDTLRAIAVRELGQSGDYTKIREWNPKLRKTDPDAPLRAGIKIVLN